MPIQNPFTEAEVQRAMEMVRMKFTLPQIAAELGRHKRSIQYQLSKRTLTPKEKERRQAKRNESRRDRKAASGEVRRPYLCADGVGTAGNAGSPKPTAEMIADRDRRASRPFTIAHDILGEPLPGRSALDQRMGAFA